MRGILWRILGGLLIGAALLLTIYNLFDSNRAAESVKQISLQLEADVKAKIAEADIESIDVPDYEKYPEMEMPTVEINGEFYIGFLEIPQLNLSLPIIGGEWSEGKLKKAPCRYEGSIYQNDMLIAGHNYRSHFSSLKKLEEGTEIYFIDTEGNIFTYSLARTEIINEYDIEGMVAKIEPWDLTLFTCTYGGKERYTLRCIKIENGFK